MTQKIAINTDFGGFGLSDEAIDLYKILTGIPPATDLYYWEIDRDNPVLIQVIEQLGDNAGGRYSSLKIVEIPDDVEWHIHEYDGLEYIAENHRTWQ
jgi:hypothetical protein